MPQTDSKKLTPEDKQAFNQHYESVINTTPSKKDLLRKLSISVQDDSAFRDAFKENSSYKIDSKFEYKRDGTEAGKILIFFNETFEKHSERSGGRRDVNEIISTFQKLGFNIKKDQIYCNLLTEDLKEVLIKLSNEDYTKFNSLIVFFLSHGSENGELTTYDGCIKTGEIWKPFINCASLKRKPKLFVYQACKGEDKSNVDNKRVDIKERIVKFVTDDHLFIPSDVLLAYSSVEGNESFRDGFSGSWFIQELCKNLNSYGRRDDILSILIRTTKCVSGNYYDKEIYPEKQMPIFVSSLRKKFYINRNKERHFQIKAVNDNEKILMELKYIKEKLSSNERTMPTRTNRNANKSVQ